MKSQQQVKLLTSSVIAKSPKQKTISMVQKFGNISREFDVHEKETMVENLEGYIGVLEVYVHQARDIHNVCIYHKQDVYAKLCLTSDPETTVSTQIINGGGQNPVFNENLRLDVKKVDSFLKCEIWMLSRIKNYLEDQLLGFTLVPISDVLVGNGKLEQEFSLSSTELFHSHAGFVQLSLAYAGALPDVLEISKSLAANSVQQDSVIWSPVSRELGKIEFPDPKVVNENRVMVSEYFGIPCAELDSQSFESFSAADNSNHKDSEVGVRIVESFSKGNLGSLEVSKVERPPTGVSTNGFPSISVPANSQSTDTPQASEALNDDTDSSTKEKTDGAEKTEMGSSAMPVDTIVQPVVSANIDAAQKVVQQEIVDMYLKSMQQFTESLAKIEIGQNGSGIKHSGEKLQAPNGNSSRVFYGSNAFF